MSLIDSFLSVFSSSTTGASTSTGYGGPASSAAQPSQGAKIWPLSAVMREELKKGIAYNMKVVLRGMQGTGKTTLLCRLSGHPMPTAYRPSAEISATTIRLCGRGCQPQEGTRVDIWDVVDDGRAAEHTLPPLPSGKSASLLKQQLELLGTVADARSIDVYQGCQLAVFLIDPTRPATLEYAVREADRVPPQTCVLLALNFNDIPPQRGHVSPADVAAACRPRRRTCTRFVSELTEGRPPPRAFSTPAMWVSISATRGTGIAQLVDAFNVPNTLIRLAAMEQRTRRLYTDLVSAADRFTVAAPRESQSTHGASEAEPAGGAVPAAPSKRVTPAAEGYAAVEAPPTASTAQPPTGQDSAPVVTQELKTSYAPTQPRAAAPPAELDEHGIEIGFFDDVVDASEDDGEQPGSEKSAADEPTEQTSPSGHRRPVALAFPRPTGVVPPALHAGAPRGESADLSGDKLPSEPTVETAGVAGKGRASPPPQVCIVDDTPSFAEEAARAAEEEAARQAKLQAAVQDTEGPMDGFFTEQDLTEAGEGAKEDACGVDAETECAADNGARAARPLTTSRSRPLTSRKGVPRSHPRRHSQDRPPEVTVDVGAMLAAMQTALQEECSTDDATAEQKGGVALPETSDDATMKTALSEDPK